MYIDCSYQSDLKSKPLNILFDEKSSKLYDLNIFIVLECFLEKDFTFFSRYYIF